MKVVAVTKDYTFKATARIHVQYRAAVEYQRVPEAHARSIVAAGAGEIVRKVSDE